MSSTRRFELFSACIVVVTVGQIMLTASTNINVYAAAQIFFVVGLLGMTQTQVTLCCFLTLKPIGLTLMLQFLAGGKYPAYLAP
jgi:hypothetical protein